MIFDDIETYIEFIAGYRDTTGKQTSYYVSDAAVISLASYDVGFVMSIADQTLLQGIALSTKQAELSLRLIKKYEKQLSKLAIQHPDHTNYRHPLRNVVHINSLTLEHGKLYFRFKFDNAKILDIKAFVKESQGKVDWHSDAKAWVFALTEYNVSWAVAYAQSKKIHVETEVQELFDLIIETEQTPYDIELRMGDDGCYISNIPSSMAEYIDKNIGYDNIYSLVDSAGVLGYKISPEIAEVITAENGPAFMKLCAAREIDYGIGEVKDFTIKEIIEWAKIVDRLPIVIYNPNIVSPEKTADIGPFFSPEEIQIVDLKTRLNKTTVPLDPSIKVVYTNKVLENWEGRMPLLITTANLMHGGTKRTFLGKAEKIVYYCESLPRKR